MMDHPANVYAKALTHPLHGYPLWEPQAHNDAPVKLGDVGYIEYVDQPSICMSN